MRLRGLTIRDRRRAAVAPILAALLGLAGCSGNNFYAGIPLTDATADPELQTLARSARAGDKHAQLELGIRFEEGRGVPMNLPEAERLYRLAASDTGGMQLVRVPAVAKGGRASTVPFSRGRLVRGLLVARARLAKLLAWRNSSAKAVKWRSGRFVVEGHVSPVDAELPEHFPCRQLQHSFAQSAGYPIVSCQSVPLWLEATGHEGRIIFELEVILDPAAVEEGALTDLRDPLSPIIVGTEASSICGRFHIRQYLFGDQAIEVFVDRLETGRC